MQFRKIRIRPRAARGESSQRDGSAMMQHDGIMLLLLLLLLLLLGLRGAATQQPATVSPKSVLLLMADDLRPVRCRAAVSGCRVLTAALQPRVCTAALLRSQQCVPSQWLTDCCRWRRAGAGRIRLRPYAHAAY